MRRSVTLPPCYQSITNIVWHRMLNLVLFGPPGAGKGTQSEKLIQKFKLVHLSTGDLLRSEIAAQTALGLQAKTLMDKGLLVPDEVVIGMIDNKLRENQADQTPSTAAESTSAEPTVGFIFDGFPRTVPQAAALDALLSRYNTAILTMIALVVDEEELTRRLLLRGQTSGRPDDQNEELIRRRVQEYTTKTTPVAGYYSQQNKYASIDGLGDIDGIFDLICQKIKQAQTS